MGGQKKLTLPTKNTWSLLGLALPLDSQFEIIVLRFRHWTKTIYVTDMKQMDPGLGGTTCWKSFIGEHGGLEVESKRVMCALPMFLVL